MDRRAFIRMLCRALFAAPLVAHAQPAGKIYRIGFLSPNNTGVGAFQSGLAQLGWVEGRNFVIEKRFGATTLEGLKAAKLLKNGKLRIDILKCPHHGSVRNVAKEYFETIVADHYVISADGKFDNPDVDTLKLISAARKDDKFTLHLTNPTEAFVKPAIGKAVKKFLDADRAAGRKYKVVTRTATDLSIQIPLIA